MKIFARLALICLLISPAALAQEAVHGIAMHGTPKYSVGEPFDYVNTNAPKGSTLRLSALGSFDSLNPYILKGVAAAGSGLVYETLMEKSHDEPFSMYGRLAETVTLAPDNTSVSFQLREIARWQDGEPVTAEDVKWSFETLLEKGRPFFRSYYGDVERVEVNGPRSVTFHFKHGDNPELPLIISQIPIFPKHFWEQEGRDFASTSLEPPIGSGPYKYGRIDAGRLIAYERDPNWWGGDLLRNQGRYNFDRISFDYYRDGNIAFEAFMGGDVDFRLENTAKLWATAYDSSALNEQRMLRETIPNKLPQGMQGFLFNIRRPVFADPVVRQAVTKAFDYEWSNRQFAYGAYTRSRSYFSNSDMEATGLPEGRELAILEPYRDQLPEEVFTEEYHPPSSDGSGQNRVNLRAAQQLLEEAGYKLNEDGVRVHEETGVELRFEFLDNNPAFERWVLPFIRNLERIGVKASFRVIDSSQYQERMNNFDFDMTVMVIPQSSSPGNEQRDFWASYKADTPGARNFIGIQDPVVDALVEQIIVAPSREELILRARALDRVLQWGHYVVPNWHLPAWRIAYWQHLKRPADVAPYDLAVTETWWSEPAAPE